jgi:hypothetical protein
VTKPPKPGFVSFGSSYLGDYQEFLGGLFLCFSGRRLYRVGIFLRSALVAALVCKRGRHAINYTGMDLEQVWLTAGVYCIPVVREPG